MKGYVLIEKGRAEWLDMPEPVMHDNDVIARPTLLAACTTDAHTIKTGGRPQAKGKVLGHEGVGVVVETGKNVKDFKPGDRVLLPSAGADFLHPRAQRGEAKFFQNNNAVFTDSMEVQGLFSERVRVIDADRRLSHIPDNVTDKQAVMVSDMMATGFTGTKYLELQYGESALILGCGPVGLMGIASARLRGAGRIIAVGSRKNTLDLAVHYGATDVVDYKKGDVYEQVMELTGGEPVDSTMIASGGSASEQFTLAMNCTKWGGHVACVSIFFEDKEIVMPSSVWNGGSREKFLTGVAIDDGRDFFERMLAMISYGRIDPSPLITHTLQGLDKLPEALDLMSGKDKDVIKAVVEI